MPKYFKFNVTLKGIEPRIWRSILVDETATFYELHEIIVDTMGWDGENSYLFNAGGKCIMPGDEAEDDCLEAEVSFLGEIFRKKGDAAEYIYDLEANWVHDLVFEGEVRDKEKFQAKCLAGARACPPENCGGLPGYHAILSKIKRSKKNVSDEYTDIYGDPYDPEEFDLEDVNNWLGEVEISEEDEDDMMEECEDDVGSPDELTSIQTKAIEKMDRLVTKFVNDALALIEPFMRKEGRDKELFRPVLEHPLAREMGEEWARHFLPQYLCYSFFSDPDTVDRYLKDPFSKKLSKKETEMFLRLKDVPPVYTAYEALRPEGTDLTRIRDLSTGQEHILLSRSVASLVRSGSSLFYGLLFDMGACWMTWGLISHFKGYMNTDFSSFARLINEPLFLEKGLQSVIDEYPVEFALLYNMAEIPLQSMKGELLLNCYHVIPWDRSEPPKGVEKWKAEKIDDNLVSYIFPNSNPMIGPFLYKDAKKKELILMGGTGEAYQRGQSNNILSKYFPRFPDWMCTMAMLIVVNKVLGKRFPYEEMSRRTSKSSEEKEESPELKKINAYMAKLTDALNAGEDVDFDGLASKMDIPQDIVDQIRKLMAKHENKNRNAEIFKLMERLDSYTPPPPKDRRIFQEPFISNPGIHLVDNPMVKAFLEKIVSKNIPGSPVEKVGMNLESDSSQFWGADGVLILNYSVFMLLQKGDVWLNASTYAAEQLYLFGHSFEMTRENHASAEFFRKYREYCVAVLAKWGLVETSPDGIDARSARKSELKIKVTPMFKAWLRWEVNGDLSSPER